MGHGAFRFGEVIILMFGKVWRGDVWSCKVRCGKDILNLIFKCGRVRPGLVRCCVARWGLVV